MNSALATLGSPEDTDGTIRIAIAGRLDASSVRRIWPEGIATLARHPSRNIQFDGFNVAYCDTAGAAMLVDFLRRPRNPGAEVEVINLPESAQRLMSQFDPAGFRDGLNTFTQESTFIERFGLAAAAFWADIRALIEFVGEATLALGEALRHPSRLRWKDLLRAADEAGTNALPIVALIAFLMGVILAFQAATAMKRFGAEIFVADLVGLSLLRELGPLMTAILLAGRSGAAFAAEIGTMKVNEEVDALTTMGFDPVRFLVVSRVLAAVAVIPVLSVFANLIGLFGGALVMLSFDISFTTYYREVVGIVDLGDLFSGLLKSLVFGLLVAGIGCLRGLQTRTGAAAVGLSTTSAVVSGIVLIVFADGVFAVIFYYLGV